MSKRPPLPKPKLEPKPPFKEPMPVEHACPPIQAMPLTKQTLMRFVGPGPVTDQDFWSYAKNDLPCPPNKVCEWVACSFFRPNIEPEKLNDLRRFPNLKSKTDIAYINFDEKSGPAEIKNTKHVSVWLFADFCPEQSVAKVIPVGSYVPE